MSSPHDGHRSGVTPPDAAFLATATARAPAATMSATSEIDTESKPRATPQKTLSAIPRATIAVVTTVTEESAPSIQG